MTKTDTILRKIDKVNVLYKPQKSHNTSMDKENKFVEMPFRRMLKKIVGNVSKQCVKYKRNKNGVRVIDDVAINSKYVRDHAMNRTTVLLYTEGITQERGTNKQTKRLRKEKRALTGFAMAHVKKDKENHNKIFYVDIICSAHRCGRQLFRMAEQVAKKLECDVIALRAATPNLIKIYNRLGYKRRANDCTHDQDPALDRRKKRDLDEHSSTWTRLTRHDREGFWMSKCLEEN